MEDSGSTYGGLLRAAIADADTSRRKLSFRLAERTGNKQASEYRALGKYLSDEETPEPERAAILAVELGVPRLALVTDVGERKRVRRGELEERVGRLEEALSQLGPDLAALASLPERVLALERPARTKKRQGGR